VDAWNSLPPEWRAVITVAATVVLIVATAGAGAALVGASWTTFAAAGVLAATASAVAWVALGIASGKVRTAEQAWDTLAGGFVAGATIFGILTTLYGVGKGLLEAEARGCVPTEGRTTNDVLANPDVLRAAPGRLRTPADVPELIADAQAKGWRVTTLGKGGQEGAGLRLLGPDGATIRFNPFGTHHSGPYWYVARGTPRMRVWVHPWWTVSR
jgi:hypothetical protein